MPDARQDVSSYFARRGEAVKQGGTKMRTTYPLAKSMMCGLICEKTDGRELIGPAPCVFRSAVWIFVERRGT